MLLLSALLSLAFLTVASAHALVKTYAQKLMPPSESREKLSKHINDWYLQSADTVSRALRRVGWHGRLERRTPYNGGMDPSAPIL